MFLAIIMRHAAARFPNDFGDPLIFPLVAQQVHLSCEISQYLLDGLAQTLDRHSEFPGDESY